MQIEKMSSTEIKELEKILEKNYGVKVRFQDILFQTKKKKIWIVSRDFPESWWEKLRLNSVGLYFGKLKRNQKIKLSLEGAQWIGNRARKNLVEIPEAELPNLLSGKNICNFQPRKADINNFVLVKCGKYVVGVGILREGYVENLLPKTRRMVLE